MKILIIDDHSLILDGLRSVLNEIDPSHQVTGCRDLEDAFRCVAMDGPFDFAFLDLGLPRHSGLTALVRFTQKLPLMRVAIITGNLDRQAMILASEHDIEGFLPKTLPPEELIDAIRKVLAGEPYFPPTDRVGSVSPSRLATVPTHRAVPIDLGDATDSNPNANPNATELTRRQRDVLHLLAKGYPNKLIARALGITPATAKEHIRAILRALGVRSRLQAVVEAQRRALLVGVDPSGLPRAA